MTNCGRRRHSAPTRISTGATARRKQSCIAITAYRHIGAVSDGVLMFRGTSQISKCLAIGTVDVSARFSPDHFVSRRKPMLAKYMMAGLAGSALLASVAFAQTPTATTDRASMAPATASDSLFQGEWRTSKVVGLNVYNDNNESLGSINDLLTDKGGNIKAVVISVGGFLGVGTHLVAVPFDKIKFVTEPIAYTGVAGGVNEPRSRPAS